MHKGALRDIKEGTKASREGTVQYQVENEQRKVQQGKNLEGTKAS